MAPSLIALQTGDWVRPAVWQEVRPARLDPDEQALLAAAERLAPEGRGLLKVVLEVVDEHGVVRSHKTEDFELIDPIRVSD